MSADKTLDPDPRNIGAPTHSALALALEYTPISLNHLVREGICLYNLKDSNRAIFQLNLSQNLNKVVGEPAQLRHLFAQLIDGLVDGAYKQPTIALSTQNVSVGPIVPPHCGGYHGLSQGIYALLRVSVRSNSSTLNQSESNPFQPVSHSNSTDLLTDDLTADMLTSSVRMNQSRPFCVASSQGGGSNRRLWSQIEETIELHRGRIINEYPTDSLIALSIAFPAIHLLQ